MGCRKTSLDELSFMALFDNPLSSEAEDADRLVGWVAKADPTRSRSFADSVNSKLAF